MIHGLLFGVGLCLAPFVVAGFLQGWRWLAVGLLALLAVAVLVLAHAVGLADWRLVDLAWMIGSGFAFFLLPVAGFDPLRSALFMNAGLVAVAVFLVQNTLPQEPELPRLAIEQQR